MDGLDNKSQNIRCWYNRLSASDYILQEKDKKFNYCEIQDMDNDKYFCLTGNFTETEIRNEYGPKKHIGMRVERFIESERILSGEVIICFDRIIEKNIKYVEDYF